MSTNSCQEQLILIQSSPHDTLFESPRKAWKIYIRKQVACATTKRTYHPAPKGHPSTGVEFYHVPVILTALGAHSSLRSLRSLREKISERNTDRGDCFMFFGFTAFRFASFRKSLRTGRQSLLRHSAYDRPSSLRSLRSLRERISEWNKDQGIVFRMYGWKIIEQ